MPRPKSIVPTVPVKAYLTQENAAKMSLVTYDVSRGRNSFGETSRIINEALAAYFAKATHVPPGSQESN